KGKLTQEQLLKKLHKNPAKILNIKPDKDTIIEVNMSEYEIKNEELKTKCAWTPFAGRKVVGKVQKVSIRNNIVYENGKTIVRPGSGKIIL
ncbi:MAG TPA: hypothetical protein VD947_00070, partial [Patescibacteria group bacterium]|nr:hypothetical protein [Patescibacteria group bacterium]